MDCMARSQKWIDQSPVREIAFIIGVILLIASPIVGAIPGPGGIIVAAAGLALMLRTSKWARRQYVRFKRWQPEMGRWTDWGLRRESAKRRAKMLKEQEQSKSEEIEEDDLLAEASLKNISTAHNSDRPSD